MTQFQSGNQEWKRRKHNNGGRSKRSTEEKFIGILRDTVKPEDWKRIVDVAISRASSGDHQARQWLSDWLQGKVPDKIEHSGAVEVWLAWNDAADSSPAEPA